MAGACEELLESFEGLARFLPKLGGVLYANHVRFDQCHLYSIEHFPCSDDQGWLAPIHQYISSGYILPTQIDCMQYLTIIIFILQDIGISFFLAAGHNVGSSLLSMNTDVPGIFSNFDDTYRIINSMFYSAVRLFCLFQRSLTLTLFSCRYSAPMPPTCLSFWQCV